MLRIFVKNDVEAKEFEHDGGPLEFGRGPRRDVERYVVTDPFISRDHLRIEPLGDGRLRIENLSRRNPAALGDDNQLAIGKQCEVALPVHIGVGTTTINICATDAPASRFGATTLASAEQTPDVDPPEMQALGDLPDMQTLSQWFQTVIAVQHAAAASGEFHHETARAVVELVGLDRGLVLVRKDHDWKVTAMHAVGDAVGPNYSRSILDEVLRRRATFCRRLGSDDIRESLANVEAVVASPVLDKDQQVVGVVYGSRTHSLGRDNVAIRPLEAQLVQVLAAAVAAGIEREIQEAEALRSQLQFEQFFSPELARELARDPEMLEGHEREITVLFSDLRNSTSIAERLGPSEMVRLMRDVFEMQSRRVSEFQGIVVDYFGDGLLAMWNAPTDQPDHAELACRAALGFLDDLPELSKKWESIVKHPLALGSGINTGPAVVGNTGSRTKFKYGPMGPNVNLAARVESATKSLGVPIVITASTRDRLGDAVATRRLCQSRLVGVANPVDLFQLQADTTTAAWQQRRDAFEQALDHFEASRWREACDTIHPVLYDDDGQYDLPSLHLLSRAVECIKTQPQQFDPVLDFQRK